MALRAPNVAWHEKFFKYPEEVPAAMDIAYECRNEYDVYFSSYLFSTPDSSVKANALPSYTIQADLDNADIRSLPLTPGTLVLTSPGRYQAYWYLDCEEPIDLELHEILSRRLTYSIQDADRSGWSIGHKVRVADTFNHKYLDGAHLVEVKNHEPRKYTLAELEMLPEVDTLTLNRFDSEFIDNPPTQYDLMPNELLETIKNKIPIGVYTSYNVVQMDRSATLWALMCAAFRAGLKRDAVYWLAKHSANNKFDRLQYHANRELAKDVLRAEHEVYTNRADPRNVVTELRKNTALAVEERKRSVMHFIYKHMQEEGDFIKTPAEDSFYIPRDTGKPVHLVTRSDNFNALLDIRYNLNPTEAYHEFTVEGILNRLTNVTPNGTHAALSFYSQQEHCLYLHSGRKEVYKIEADSVTTVTDGHRGIVFPWDIHAPFQPQSIPGHVRLDWPDMLFGDLHNTTDLTPQEAKLLLRVWFLFMLFRDAAQSRPILALFGQPGSGKTTVMHRVHELLYGGKATVLAVTSPNNFDQSTTTRPLVALDNVDTWEPWLPDRLAQSASVIDIEKRKLWSDTDTVHMRRQAMVAITAHNPKFNREDVVDRLLLINLSRLPEFEPETPMLDLIRAKRNHLWQSIVLDCQDILKNPLPKTTTLRFRIADFARLGEWIADGIDQLQEFRDLINKIVVTQINHNLQTDQVLVGALLKVGIKGGTKDEWLNQQQIYTLLHSQLSANDALTFTKMYKNQMGLGKKLWTLIESLGKIIKIEFKEGEAGARYWKIGELISTAEGGGP